MKLRFTHLFSIIPFVMIILSFGFLITGSSAASLSISTTIPTFGTINSNSDLDVTQFTGLQTTIGGYFNSWEQPEYWEKSKELGVKTVLFLALERRFGEYYVDTPSWISDSGGENSKDTIQQTIDLAHSNGIKIIAYFGSQECSFPLAEANYADSILYNEGHPVKGWWSDSGNNDFDSQHTYIMNPDPKLSYGTEMLRQATLILDDWGFDGLFVDRLDYDGFIEDTDINDWISPHPDDPTPISNGMISFLAELRTVCHSRGKILIGNGPMSVRTTPFIDIIAKDHHVLNTEGMTGYMYLEWYDFFRMISPEGTPISLYLVDDTPSRDQLESFLQWCVTGQVIPYTLAHSSNMISFDYANKDLYDLYLPQILPP